MRVLGVDGCRGGWVGVVLADEGLAAISGPTVASILEAVGPVDAVGVDIPIGLPLGAARAADVAALRARILEVAAWLPRASVDVREVHPEVSFAVLAGRPLLTSKRTWNGAHERRAALATAGIRVPDRLGPAGSLAAVDDVLDAAVAAWTARRVARGQAVSFPSPPEDAAIWA